MTNMRGYRVENPHPLKFSFYFSTKDGMPGHGPRAKVTFNPERIQVERFGTQKLCDDWEFIPGKVDSHIKAKDIAEMKQFFRTYLVLFLADWDYLVDDIDVANYLLGNLSLHELVRQFDFYLDAKDELDQVFSIQELEKVCRDNHLLNFYGN